MDTSPIEIKTKRGYRWPFSRGLVVESLVRAGMRLEDAEALARGLEAQLIAEGRRTITPDELKGRLLETLRELGHAEVARRLARQLVSFEEIWIEGPEGARPFSKGVLARSLEEAGFELPEAYRIAQAVEERLRQAGKSRVPEDLLETTIHAAIADHAGEEALWRYKDRRHLMGAVFVAEPEGEPRVPFSKGILAQSVMSAGLSPERAYRIAREVERELLEEGRRVISRPELRERVFERIREEAGEDLARRYLLLRMARRLERPLHILIGGVTGVGKSALASALAWRLGITRLVGSDAVREILRATVPKELVPSLHVSTFEAWRVLAFYERRKTPTPKRVVRGFLDQAARVAVGLRAIQERSAREATSLVMEGVHVVPPQLAHAYKDAVIEVPMIVVLEDEETHRSRFLYRERETGAKRPKERYLKHFQEIRWIQEYLIELAEATGIPVIPGEDHDKAVEKGLEVIAERIAGVGPLEVET